MPKKAEVQQPDTTVDSSIELATSSDDPMGTAARADGETVERRSVDKRLQSLTPKYEQRHHGTYLKRLEQAVKGLFLPEVGAG